MKEGGIRSTELLKEFFDSKRFDYREIETKIREFWKENEIYSFDKSDTYKQFLIDTPPPYANGPLHHGHGMSYTHIDIMARYKRFDHNTLLPLCFDDNGLPTEKFTEKKHEIDPHNRPDNFIDLCKQEAELSIQEQMQQLEYIGFSYNHKLSYRTIDERSWRITQENFIELFDKGYIKQRYNPQLFCMSCQTALTQADLEKTLKASQLHYIKFPTEGAQTEFIEITTTRPEFIPATIAIMYNPLDERFKFDKLRIFNPLTHDQLPLISSEEIDLDFGTGLMMLSTFGGQDDIKFFREFNLEEKIILSEDGKFNSWFPEIQGLKIAEARQKILHMLQQKQLLTKSDQIEHKTSICERCKTPIEITMSNQWELEILDSKEELTEISRSINWFPAYMFRRLENWISGLKWDWTISRQRFYGIPIPVWNCANCETLNLPSKKELPLDPRNETGRKCRNCFEDSLIPDGRVFDTWMTSSLTPRILNEIYEFDETRAFDLRPQAHEIIRTWAYYTILKSYSSFGTIPWDNIQISGWGLGFTSQGKRQIKASKSEGSGFDPIDLCKEYGTDVFRYWAALARLGKDQYLEEQSLRRGQKLITKIFNAAKLTLMMLDDDLEKNTNGSPLSELIETMNKRMIEIEKEYINLMNGYNFTDALKLIENTFWKEYCSDYLEKLKKQRKENTLSSNDIDLIRQIFSKYNKLFSPFFPFLSEYLHAIYWRALDPESQFNSIHQKISL